jgi:very-short-patch-repair endonuclease
MVAHGWSVVRFWNGSVLTERQSVLETIVAILDGRLQENVVANDMWFLMGRKEIDD